MDFSAVTSLGLEWRETGCSSVIYSRVKHELEPAWRGYDPQPNSNLGVVYYVQGVTAHIDAVHSSSPASPPAVAGEEWLESLDSTRR
jgi:hypothetical protein